ncbi:Nucleotidylyl transferase [Cystobasidium minutum MCA 4210]|uniref:Nucleotidylyl transferase n=1 Tax=Cystobasidium minutum MCA 4210 TaxID=1397322 RepID=UPI0034CD9DF7|eukprot:jgi/Rhomi1/196014/gm1.4228_g
MPAISSPPSSSSQPEDILPRYDVLLVLNVSSHSSITSLEHYVKALRDISTKSSRGLLIYFPITPLWLHLSRNRSKSFQILQKLLSELYILATASLPEDTPCDVVIQVLRGQEPQDILVDTANIQPEDLKHMFGYVEVVNDADAPDNGGGNGQHAGAITSSNGADEAREDDHLGTIALGGTFDHLHAGHKVLLSMACWLARRRVIVGISDDVLLKNKSDREYLESLETRTHAVKSFLDLVCPHIQHDLPALQDVYGPTSTDPDVQGIIFSEESRKGAVAVAEIRKERNLSTLETFVINVISPEVVIDTDTVGKEEMLKAKMGSTHIRRRLRERAEQEKSKTA